MWTVIVHLCTVTFALFNVRKRFKNKFSKMNRMS